MTKLIKEYFELAEKQNWINKISKEVDKLKLIREKLDAQSYVVSKMLDRYKEIYGEDLRAKSKGE